MDTTGADDCSESLHRLYHFLDGELTDERRAAIAHHLDECSPCLDAFDFEAELRVMISLKCRERVPDGLIERIAAAIRQERGWPGPAGRGDAFPV
ncbi:MAG TPA: mycothiol system anti-sigma-R factor [Acidimicrobiales bacterium]|nr:mycothiol system anti-sigma-R factor [Acidimicrobiales bacterium]